MCATFNQASYIKQCLDSLVSQKTNFPYKVIVHDDASTDGTTEIVRDYARRYPDLVTAVIQESNIYSRGISYEGYTNPYLVDCKYIALCEGDDWWLCPDKLQLQYDYMEQHPECSLCVHEVELFDDARQKRIRVTPGNDDDKEYSLDEVILGGGGLFGTNSMFFRMKDRDKSEEYLNWGVGDYPVTIWLATLGSVHCIGRTMSAYRINAKGSWTSRHGSDLQKAQQTNDKIIAGLESVDECLGYEHHAAIEKAIARQNDDTLWIRINRGFDESGTLVKPSDIDDLGGFLSRQTTRLKIRALIKLYLPFINSMRLRISRRG